MAELNIGELLKELREKAGLSQRKLALLAGVDRTHISHIEAGRAGSISLRTARALAKPLNVTPDIFLKDDRESHKETPEEILDRLRLATPIAIPVYPWEAFPFHAGEGIEPVEYVYRARPKMAGKNVEAYIVRGDCMKPQINDDDIIVVDKDRAIDNGDIIACLVDNHFHVLKVRKVADELWLENNHGKFKFEQTIEAAPVIEVIRRLK